MYTMRKEFCLFVITILFFQVCFAQRITKNVKTVLFLGNSITWQGNYVNDIEAYYRYKNPGHDIELSMQACQVKRFPVCLKKGMRMENFQGPICMNGLREYCNR